MRIINVVSKLPFKFSNGKMDLKNIDTLVVHHDAISVTKPYDTLQRIKAIAALHMASPKNYGGHIAYHFMIDNVGDIYQCLPENEVGYHAGNLRVNKKSIAVCLHGNLQTMQPKAKQLKALEEFCFYMFNKRPDIPKLVKSGLKMHKEVRLLPTACPGKNLVPFVIKLRK